MNLHAAYGAKSVIDSFDKNIPSVIVHGIFPAGDDQELVLLHAWEKNEYVTARYGFGEKEWSLGHYFSSYADALADFGKRIASASAGNR